MASLKISVLFAFVAVLAFESLVTGAPYFDDLKENSLDESKDQLKSSSIPDITDEEDTIDKVNDDDKPEVDGVPIQYLTDEEADILLDEGDKKFASNLGIPTIKKLVQTREDGSDAGVDGVSNIAATRGGRHRRWVLGLLRLLIANRALVRGAVKGPITKSGNRITHHYTKPGNLEKMNTDFNRFGAKDVKDFSKNGINGKTGTAGKNTVTARDGSKQGNPTLEIRSPPKKGIEHVTKVRYEQ